MYNRRIYAEVKLGIVPVTSGVRVTCDSDSDDSVYHQLVTCDRLTAQRNILSEKLFGHLS